jgi:hypothetical protein
MAIYDFHIEIASYYGHDNDEAAWEIMEKIKQAVKEVPEPGVQWNFGTLQKNRKDYPRSKKELQDKIERDLALAKHNAEEKVKRAHRDLIKAQDELTKFADKVD